MHSRFQIRFILQTFPKCLDKKQASFKYANTILLGKILLYIFIALRDGVTGILLYLNVLNMQRPLYICTVHYKVILLVLHPSDINLQFN